MNDQQLLTLWLGAFRYYLGRSTYAVSDFCDIISQEWENIPSHTRSIIKKELEKEIQRDDDSRENGYEFHHLGDDSDRARWVCLLRKIEEIESASGSWTASGDRLGESAILLMPPVSAGGL